MKFSWINKQGVKSDSGFIVQRTDRFTIEYQEGERTLEIIVESCRSKGKPALEFRKESFSKWSSSKSEQVRVLNNFKAALLFKGQIPVEI